MKDDFHTTRSGIAIQIAHVALLSFVLTSLAEGIPEPGLLIQGVVSNRNGPFPLPSPSVQWTITGGGSSCVVTSTVANVNGQYLYIARIPFETRAVSGITFPPTANTLPLTDEPTPFTRSASLLGTNATLAPPASASFNFGKADRGRIERVDLLVNWPTDPVLDSDGDGVPDWAEQIAGTNPNDANSVFKASSDLEPAPGGGLILKWSSVAGKTYTLLRSTNLNGGFSALAEHVTATAPQNSFVDSSASGAGPYFYRIQVSP